MRSAVRKIGNSAGVIIPKALLDDFGARTGDAVDVSVENGRLVVAREKRRPRQGWEEDAKALTEAGEDGLVWPEFKDDVVEDWEW